MFLRTFFTILFILAIIELVVEILVIVPHCFFDLKFESQNHSNETAVEISGKAADHVRQLLTISCIGLMILINVITMKIVVQ
ncbi:unnamed protein product [Didymodactylos carnosus]|uniref:Uncharacterized protein n=1 Tax=Didymodactylos carnosus TaxID=1234261 RepID=A0A815TRG5_9BILA|nr:unnamed protein product [Didymodactylos carnosus]CAF4371048.1 unnamed protein product [Didymodactylos carnosus]